MFVISDRELELLSGGGLSNEDRAVYLLSLRPVARNGKAVLDRDVIAEQMAVRDHRGPGSISDDELQDMRTARQSSSRPLSAVGKSACTDEFSSASFSGARLHSRGSLFSGGPCGLSSSAQSQVPKGGKAPGTQVKVKIQGSFRRSKKLF